MVSLLNVTATTTSTTTTTTTTATTAATRQIYVAVFDTVQSEHFGFGLSLSDDGLHWSAGVDVALPGGCRTPLGLIDEGNGLVTVGVSIYLTISLHSSYVLIVLQVCDTIGSW